MKIPSLKERDGLMFEPKQKNPFTGKYVIYWNDRDEQKKEGLMTVWYEHANITNTE